MDAHKRFNSDMETTELDRTRAVMPPEFRDPPKSVIVPPPCEDCAEEGEMTVSAERWDVPWSPGHLDLCERHAERRREQFIEKQMSDFHGGSGAYSVAEQCDRALAKREGK